MHEIVFAMSDNVLYHTFSLSRSKMRTKTIGMQKFAKMV